MECEQQCGVDVQIQSYSACDAALPDVSPATTPESNKQTDREAVVACIRRCPIVSADYNPVCGSNNVTYLNRERFECERKCGLKIELAKSSPCEEEATSEATTEAVNKVEKLADCIRTCPVTGEYNPVCGTNNVTYTNPARLECARNCGVNVQLTRSKSCTSPLTEDEKKIISDSYGGSTPPADEFVYSSTTSTTTARPYINLNTQAGIDIDSKGIYGYTSSTGYHGKEEDSKEENEGSQPKEDSSNKGNESNHPSGDSKETPGTMEVLQCMQSCVITPEVNPVCGTNSITYSNPGQLLCSQFCGIDVRVLKYGSCSSSSNAGSNINCVTTCKKPSDSGYFGITGKPDNTGSYNSNTEQPSITEKPKEKPVTKPVSLDECMAACRTPNNYKPVCGTNFITYTNMEKLQCAQQCGVNVFILKESQCSTTTVSEVPLSITPSPKPNYGSPITPPQDCIEQCAGQVAANNPICGSDNVTYKSLAHLICARSCGTAMKNIKLKSMFPCAGTDDGLQQSQQPEISQQVLDDTFGTKQNNNDEELSIDQRIKNW